MSTVVVPKFIPINFPHARARIRNFSGSTELCPNNLPRCLFCITLLAKLIYIICNILPVPFPNPPFLSFLSSLKISFPSTTLYMVYAHAEKRKRRGRPKGNYFYDAFPLPVCTFFTYSCLYPLQFLHKYIICRQSSRSTILSHFRLYTLFCSENKCSGRKKIHFIH